MPTKPMPKIFPTALSLALLLSVANAQAELGGAVTPAPSNIQTTLRAQSQSTTAPAATTPSTTTASTVNANYTVQQNTDAAGTSVREYADNDGTVFAVSWQGQVKPDLKQLLGKYFQPFIDASTASPHAGTGPITVREGDLVVYSGGHPRAFFGSAYVPTLIPNGVAIDALQ
jgi:hypothetical protein